MFAFQDGFSIQEMWKFLWN